MEGSPTIHYQQGDRIVQNENNPISNSKSPFCDNNLFDAILYGDLDNVMRCIDRGALVNRLFEGTEITALHLAVACGNISIARLLLERGADVRRRDKKGREAVHVAAALGNPEMLGLLIDNSCDVNSVVAADTDELTFENKVYKNDDIAMNKIPKMEKGDTSLSLATKSQHEKCVILLIERGAKIDLDKTIDFDVSSSRTTFFTRYIIDMLQDGVGIRPSTTPVVIRGGEEFKLSTTNLHEAIEQEDLPLIDFLVDFDPCQLVQEKDGLFPLHQLVLKKMLKPTENILTKMNELQIRDAQDHIGRTPLYIAVQKEWLPGVKALLKAGADVTLYPTNRETVLHIAATYSQLEILEELLKSSKSGEIQDVQNYLGWTPLYIAVKEEWLPGVIALLEAGADVTIYYNNRNTVMHLAACSILPEILEELLKTSKSGEIQDAQDSQGCTPLYIAVYNKRLPGVKGLLDAGADVTLYPEDRETVLHLAAAFSQHEILEELLKSSKSGEIINMVNDSKETPLCSAVRAGQRHNVEILTYKGADPYFKLPGGRTLLHLAAEQGRSDILEAVIFVCNELSILNYSDINGLTALHVAALNGSHSCVDVLISYGCDVDKKTKVDYLSGSTPLHLAAEKGHNEVVEQIIYHKEDTLNITDANNYIPIQTAAKSNNKECVRFMLFNGAYIGAIVKDEFGNEMTALKFIVGNLDNAGEFLTEILDQCIIEYMNPENRFNKSTITVKYDLFRHSSYGNQLRVLESFLNFENEDVEENLLLHPVIETYLYVKWRKFKVFFFTMIVLQMAYTISLTVIAMALYTTESQTMFVNNSVFICRCTLSASLLITILMELLQASRIQRYHFKDIESWVKWTMILLSLLVLVGDHPADWLIDVSAVAVLLSWIELLFQISRWHSFPGLYVLMFFAVANNVIKVLATFFFVILGYVFAFMIYFRAKGPFHDWPTSFYKVMVMMNELDYDSVFEDFGKEDVLVGRGIFLSFMVLVVLVLMNLLVGLAVDDIQNLKKKGKVKCLAKQIGFFCMLELFLHSISVSKYCPNKIVKLIETWMTKDQKLTIEPGNSQSYIKKSLEASLRNIIKKQKSKSIPPPQWFRSGSGLQQTCCLSEFPFP